MKIGTFVLLLTLPFALTGCLQKAATKMESLISSFALPAPAQDPANPPNFDNVEARGFVHFKGTCLNYVDSFQIQFVGDLNSDGVVGEHSSWKSIPATAPTDTRTSALQTAYPLNPATYDASCVSDGAYDFWVLMSQVDDWTGGTHVPIDIINLRGMYGLIPTNILAFNTNSNGSQQDANSFQFHAGHSPIGNGLCGELNVYLSYESAGSIDHNVTNSKQRNFTATFDTGLDLNDEIMIYESLDCSGSPKSNFSFNIPAPATHKKFSYKLNYTVDPMKNIALRSTDFGATPVIKSAGVSSATAGSAEQLYAWNKVFIDDGRCESISVVAVDTNRVATNTFDYGNVTVTATLSNTSNFEFVNNCNNQTPIAGSTFNYTFSSGGAYKYMIYVRAKTGTTSTTSANLTFSQSAPEFSYTLPTVYINPPQPIHHMKIARLDNVANLVNHECYPIEVSLRDSSNGLIAPGGLVVSYRLHTQDFISLHTDSDCATTDISNSNQTFVSAQSSKIYYWKRTPPAAGPSAGTTSGGIMFDMSEVSPYISNSVGNIHFQSNLVIKPGLSDYLMRGVNEVPYWFAGDTTNLTGDFNLGTATFFSRLGVVSNSMQNSYDSIRMAYRGTDEGRLISRKVFDFDINRSNTGNSPWPTLTSSVVDFNLQNSGSAAIFGVFAKLNLVNSQVMVFSQINHDASSWYEVPVYSDGSIYVRRGNSPYDNICSAPTGTISNSTWTMIAVKFYRVSTQSYCQIYVNGVPVGASAVLPHNLSSTMSLKMGHPIDTNLSIHGDIAEIFVDVDLGSTGQTRFSNDVMAALYDNYFLIRYPADSL